MVEDWLVAIEASGLGQTARASVWAYPLANLLHVLGAALLVGGIAVLDLAMIRRRAEAAAVIARYAIPLAALGLVLQVASGSVLFAAEATALGRNPAFLVKMGLILVGLVNLVLHHAARRRPAEGLPDAGRAAGHAVVSLATWVGVLIAGRSIAYL